MAVTLEVKAVPRQPAETTPRGRFKGGYPKENAILVNLSLIWKP
jgi:hypothetical protein